MDLVTAAITVVGTDPAMEVAITVVDTDPAMEVVTTAVGTDPAMEVVTAMGGTIVAITRDITGTSPIPITTSPATITTAGLTIIIVGTIITTAHPGAIPTLTMATVIRATTILAGSLALLWCNVNRLAPA